MTLMESKELLSFSSTRLINRETQRQNVNDRIRQFASQHPEVLLVDLGEWRKQGTILNPKP